MFQRLGQTIRNWCSQPEEQNDDPARTSASDEEDGNNSQESTGRQRQQLAGIVEVVQGRNQEPHEDGTIVLTFSQAETVPLPSVPDDSTIHKNGQQSSGQQQNENEESGNLAIITQDDYDNTPEIDDTKEKHKSKRCPACNDWIADSDKYCHDCLSAMLPIYDLDVSTQLSSSTSVAYHSENPPSTPPAAAAQRNTIMYVPVTPHTQHDKPTQERTGSKGCMDCGDPVDMEYSNRCAPCYKVFTSPKNNGTAAWCRKCGTREDIHMAWRLNFCSGCLRQIAKIESGKCALCLRKETNKRNYRFCSPCYNELASRTMAATVTPAKRKLDFDKDV